MSLFRKLFVGAVLALTLTLPSLRSRSEANPPAHAPHAHHHTYWVRWRSCPEERWATYGPYVSMHEASRAAMSFRQAGYDAFPIAQRVR